MGLCVVAGSELSQCHLWQPDTITKENEVDTQYTDSSYMHPAPLAHTEKGQLVFKQSNVVEVNNECSSITKVYL